MNDMMNPDALQEEYTGRYIVTFRESAIKEGVAMMNKSIGSMRLAATSDFTKSGWDAEAMESADGACFETLGMAVVKAESDALASLQAVSTAEDSPILAIEPEMMMYAISELELLAYAKGYRDGVDGLYQNLRGGGLGSPGEAETAAAYNDTPQATWGLQATRAINSQRDGRGMRVAVLDTGMDLKHPDFAGRRIVSRSFIAGQTVQDGHGHGTHCIGTACGSKSNTGRRYGVAPACDIYAGKVLSNAGSGGDAGILAGIEWAIANKCQVISMSLGAVVCATTVAYEQVGQRALANGSLVVVAAGNSANRAAGQYSCVNRPANSVSMMAVAALDSNLTIANFSARSSNIAGGAVDIAGPGVNVYSSWPMATRYRSISGTSMATPHVAGVTALFAQATGLRGAQLWQMLVSRARRLPIPSLDVGTGLVQAP